MCSASARVTNRRRGHPSRHAASRPDEPLLLVPASRMSADDALPAGDGVSAHHNPAPVPSRIPLAVGIVAIMVGLGLLVLMLPRITLSPPSLPPCFVFCMQLCVQCPVMRPEGCTDYCWTNAGRGARDDPLFRFRPWREERGICAEFCEKALEVSAQADDTKESLFWRCLYWCESYIDKGE